MNNSKVIIIPITSEMLYGTTDLALINPDQVAQDFLQIDEEELLNLEFRNADLQLLINDFVRNNDNLQQNNLQNAAIPGHFIPIGDPFTALGITPYRDQNNRQSMHTPLNLNAIPDDPIREMINPQIIEMILQLFGNYQHIIVPILSLGTINIIGIRNLIDTRFSILSNHHTLAIVIVVGYKLYLLLFRN